MLSQFIPNILYFSDLSEDIKYVCFKIFLACSFFNSFFVWLISLLLDDLGANLGLNFSTCFGIWGWRLTSFCLLPRSAPAISMAQIYSCFVTHPSSLSSSKKSIMVHACGDAWVPVDHSLNYQAYWPEA